MKKKESLPLRADERGRILDERRKWKMAASAHAYVRGSTVRFYEWLDKSASTLPKRRRPSPRAPDEQSGASPLGP
jgi:hypothetical protein